MTVSMSCLDAVAVQGFVEGTLDAGERASVEVHIDQCPECRRLIAALAMTNPPTAPDTDRADRTDRADAANGPDVANADTMMTATPGSAPSSHIERRIRAPIDRLGTGTEIGRYRIVGYLGRGGMGIVYHAHDPELRRDVALKLLRSDAVPDTFEPSARLLREAQAMAQIAHPNVISVFDVGEWNDEVFVAMELVSGGTLRAWCLRSHTHAEVLAAFASAGRGLAAAHAAGLVHRDFKPDNVLVGSDGRMRVTDFGLARTHDMVFERRTVSGVEAVPLDQLTQTGAVMGTPGYMAPELYAGETSDARTDQFAFCVALWEALQGAKPFAAKTEEELVKAIETGDLAPPSKKLPTRLLRAIRRGLSARPADRWPTMEALLVELEPKHRGRLSVAFAALAGLAIIGSITFALVSSSSSSSSSSSWSSSGSQDAPPSTPGAKVVTVAPHDAAIADGLTKEQGATMAAITPMMHSAITHWSEGKRTEARQEMEEAIARARAAKIDGALIPELVTYSTMLMNDGELAQAEQYLNEALEVAERFNDEKQRTNVLVALVTVLDKAGRPDERLRKLALGSQTRTALDDDSKAGVLETQADASKDLAITRQKLDEALAIRNKLPTQAAKRALNRSILARHQVGQQDWDSAVNTITDAIPRVEDSNDPQDIVFAKVTLYSMLATTQVGREAWPEAEDAARKLIAVWQASRGMEVAFAAPSYTLLAEALAHQGKRAEADETFAKALALTKGAPLMEAQIHQGIAVAYYTDPDRKKYALDETTKALSLVTQAVGTDHPDAIALRVLQIKMLMANKMTAKVPALAEVLLPRLANDELMEADVRFALARALPARDHKRAHELALQAKAVYVKVGAPRKDMLEKVEAWLAHPQ